MDRHRTESKESKRSRSYRHKYETPVLHVDSFPRLATSYKRQIPRPNGEHATSAVFLYWSQAKRDGQSPASGRYGRCWLAGFVPGVTLCLELGFQLSLCHELGFEFSLCLGNDDVDHEAQSVGEIACR